MWIVLESYRTLKLTEPSFPYVHDDEDTFHTIEIRSIRFDTIQIRFRYDLDRLTRPISRRVRRVKFNHIGLIFWRLKNAYVSRTFQFTIEHVPAKFRYVLYTTFQIHLHLLKFKQVSCRFMKRHQT